MIIFSKLQLFNLTFYVGWWRAAPFPELSSRNKHGHLFEIRTISEYLEQNHNVGKSKQMFERCQILARLCTVYAESLHTREAKGEDKA